MEMKQINIVLIFSVLFIGNVWSFRYVIHPDRDLSMVQMIQKHGYPVETHRMITADGYLTEGFRIPRGKNSTTSIGESVLLLHGQCGSSENFIVAGPNAALAFFLADNGYDVWLVNNKGNRHGRAHQVMDPDKNSTFWKFGWHEIGIYDIPAYIDYILELTNRQKLFFVGHSGGSTSYLAFAADRPDYSNKIKLAALLAPAAIFRNSNPVMMYLSSLFVSLQKSGMLEVFPLDLNNLINSILKIVCAEVTIIGRLCNAMITGRLVSKHIDELILQNIFQTSPAGCAIQGLVHYNQLQKKGNFYKYDYGVKGNLKVYKSRRPPLYNLTNAISPIALFHTTSDLILDTEGIMILAKELPNLAKLHLVPAEDFAHVDMVFGKNNRRILQEPLLQLFKKYS